MTWDEFSLDLLFNHTYKPCKVYNISVGRHPTLNKTPSPSKYGIKWNIFVLGNTTFVEKKGFGIFLLENKN